MFIKKLLVTSICIAGICFAFNSACNAKPVTAPIVRMPIAQQANFWGDPKTKIYHCPACKYVKKINKAIAIDSPMTASRCGYKPCKKCKPPKIRK